MEADPLERTSWHHSEADGLLLAVYCLLPQLTVRCLLFTVLSQ